MRIEPVFVADLDGTLVDSVYEQLRRTSKGSLALSALKAS